MAGTMGAFGADLSSIGQMLDRRQNNAQFLRTLLSSEMEQARQAQRQNAALQLQRELGMGSLGLDRDRFGFEQELGRGAQGLNRDRFNLEAELGRGAQGLAGQRFGFEQEMGRGQQELAGKRFGLEQELGRGGLSNAMGRLQLDERSADRQFGFADRQLAQQASQFDKGAEQAMAIERMKVELHKALPGIQTEADITRMATELVLGKDMETHRSALGRETAAHSASLGSAQRTQEAGINRETTDRNAITGIYTTLRAMPAATDESAATATRALAKMLGIKLADEQPQGGTYDFYSQRVGNGAPMQAAPQQPMQAPVTAQPQQPAAPMQAAPKPMGLGPSAPPEAVQRFAEYSRWLANLEGELARGTTNERRLRFLTSTIANVRNSLDGLLGAYGGG